MGLDQVRDLTRRTIERILHGRPYRTLEDFFARADPRPQEAADLAGLGALEGFGSIPALLHSLEGGSGERLWRGDPTGQMSLFDEPRGGGDLTRWRGKTGRWSRSSLPRSSYSGSAWRPTRSNGWRSRCRAAGAIPTLEAAGRIGERVTVAGLRQSGHRSRTAKGEAMMFLTLEDLSRDAGRGAVPGRLPQGQGGHPLIRSASGNRCGGNGPGPRRTAAEGGKSCHDKLR